MLRYSRLDTNRRHVAPILLVVIVAFAACGGSSNGDQSAKTKPSSARPSVQGRGLVDLKKEPGDPNDPKVYLRETTTPAFTVSADDWAVTYEFQCHSIS
jgi:hypothetical protein